MTQIACGPYAVIDGPPPAPPRYGLLQAAEKLLAGVRFVTDGDRWMNGVKQLPYFHEPGSTWSTFDQSGPAAKDAADGEDEQQFWPLTVYVPGTCSAFRMADEAEFRTRININLAAVESAVVANALMTGDGLPLASPRLSDGGGEFPNGNTPLTLPQAIAALEGAIARSRRAGIIHMSPIAASLLSAAGHIFMFDSADQRGQDVLMSRLGTLVIPDAGYIDGAAPAPDGLVVHPPASATQEWMYASGFIDVRRTATEVMPPTLAQALDTGMSASLGNTNTITFLAERNYLVNWDNTLQAAVLANRSLT